MDSFYFILVGIVVFTLLWVILLKASNRWVSIFNLVGACLLALCNVVAPVVWYGIVTPPAPDTLGLIVLIILALATTVVGYGGIIFVVRDIIKESKLQKQFAIDRQAWYDKAKADGFDPTIKLVGSRRNLFIDEPNDRWFCMNMRYYPANTVMHKISDIRSMERAANIEQTIETGSVYVGRGVSLGGGRVNSYYTKLGILVCLKDTEHPTEFINCIGNPDDVERIMSIFNTILEKQRSQTT